MSLYSFWYGVVISMGFNVKLDHLI